MVFQSDVYRNHLKYSFDGCQKHLNSKTGNGSRITICPLTHVIMPERSFPTKQLNTSEAETKYCPIPAFANAWSTCYRIRTSVLEKKCDLYGHQSDKC
ncbi:hypothetical protein CDAR_477891 [Caerostris darwini]|uniref:Uncharacterized protein n=1 Tax=Caerostris darwini TaxID=1538125 RepID=A0AAV4SWY6_9ARAC|nr:hypothetical protein CDAR_477891 [Caerostris darwini]